MRTKRHRSNALVDRELRIGSDLHSSTLGVPKKNQNPSISTSHFGFSAGRTTIFGPSTITFLPCG